MAIIDIKTEITGNVWKIVAQIGQSLEEDEPILILESMKMEIPVNATEAEGGGGFHERIIGHGCVSRERNGKSPTGSLFTARTCPGSKALCLSWHPEAFREFAGDHGP